jgi:hypothetical protein
MAIPIPIPALPPVQVTGVLIFPLAARPASPPFLCGEIVSPAAAPPLQDELDSQVQPACGYSPQPDNERMESQLMEIFPKKKLNIYLLRT